MKCKTNAFIFAPLSEKENLRKLTESKQNSAKQDKQSAMRYLEIFTC